MCGPFKNQAVYVGFLSAQNERIPDNGSRDGAGACCVGMFLSTRIHEPANNQAFNKWMSLITLQYPDGICFWLHPLCVLAINSSAPTIVVYAPITAQCTPRLNTNQACQHCTPNVFPLTISLTDVVVECSQERVQCLPDRHGQGRASCNSLCCARLQSKAVVPGS